MTILRETGLVSSSTEARNAITSGGVKLDEVAVTDVKALIKVDKNKKLIQVGKKKFGCIVEKDLKS